MPGTPRLIAALLLCATATTAAAWDAPLFSIPTHSAGAERAGEGPLRVALYARELGLLAEVLGAEAPTPGAASLYYTIDAYPQLSALPSRSWLESTFLIDYAEPELAVLREELIAEHGEAPTFSQLVDFVSGVFEVTHARGWDVASVAARNRVGNCAQHAVVTAALARSLGIPARVALGAAVLQEGGRFGTYGHAWVELHNGERWVTADAALRQAEGFVRYLPFGVLEDEGPGFGMAMIRFTPIWLQRLDVMGEETAPQSQKLH